MAENDGGYQVKVSGRGINVDTKTDQATALAVIQIVMGGAARQSSPKVTDEADSIGGRGASIKGRASLRDFVDFSGAKNIAAQITAIGAFICNSEGKEEFTREEVGSNFKGAGLPPPKNLHRDFQSALGKGWIGEARCPIPQEVIAVLGAERTGQRADHHVHRSARKQTSAHAIRVT